MTVTHAAIVEQVLARLSPAPQEHDQTIPLAALNYVKDRLASVIPRRASSSFNSLSNESDA
jgi:hypothetical protein